MKQFIKFFQVMILVILWGGAQAQAPYCLPAYSYGCGVGDGLVLFQLNTISQPVACNGSPYTYYHDWTAISTTLQTGIGYTMTVQAGYSGTYVTVWIDYNNNNAFEAGEIVVNGLNCVYSYTNYSATITVPNGTTLGNHRLRFRTNWLSAISDPCSSVTYGNAADFTINAILPPPVGTLQGTVTNFFDGTPVAGASVTVNALTPVATNGAGFYQKTNVPSGNATILATATNYQNYNGTAVIASGQTTVKNFTMTPVPSYLQGYITNGCTNAPVHGAKIQVGSTWTYSLPNGYYSFQAYPAGSQTVTVTKPGFVISNAVTTIAIGGTTNYNVTLMCTANSPGTETATLNGTSTAVDISWLPPSGDYEIIYDDGVRENWTVWATAGNMNAVKFTPITGGAKVIAGKVNIGDAVNYATGTDPTLLAPFQIAVYDATGPGGMPGNPIGNPIDIIPTNFGWNVFTFPSGIDVTGNFYLVMIQGGTPPNAAGLAVDETTNKLRSYSKFVGKAPWLPASGNYMLRAVVNGQGGPLDIDALASKTEITANPIEGLIYEHTPATVTGVEGDADYVPAVIPYTVWRLLEGQEANEPAWGAPIASNITATSVTDNAWPSLPDGAYRWAVKAGYPVNRFSPPTFSNVIGKNWTAAVTVNVDLTCDVSSMAGAVVKLQNTAFSQYVYTATTTSTGTVSFPAVWKGTYDLTVTLIGYDAYSQTGISIMGPMTFDVTLLQQKLSPSNMYVGNKTLLAIWNAPVGLGYSLNEDWSSGSFATNNWAYEANWAIYTGLGNPAPSAWFYYYPTLYSYSRSLTSKTLTGTGSPDQKLLYDIYLSDYLSDGLEYLDVEMQIGAGAWTSIKQYANNGSIPWTTETINIASVGSQTFNIRFRAHGANSYNINYWVVDNIKVRSVSPDPKPCILSYVVYLNGMIEGFTPTGFDTTYQIAPSHVTYGTSYLACVKAVYGSGYSAQACTTFVSKWLYPPTNLQVEAVECAAYLTWEKPVAYKKTHIPAFKGTIEQSAIPPSAGLAPINRSEIDQGQAQRQKDPNNNIRGSIAFGSEAINYNFVDFDLDNLAGLTILGPDPYQGSDFVNGMVYPVGVTDVAYAVTFYTTHLFTIDHGTLAWSDLGSYGSGSMQEITVDPLTDIIYATSGSNLYSIDPTGPSATMIGPHGGGITLMIGIACDGNGDLWAFDIINDAFYSVDKTTGAATMVGPLGWNANYAQSMFYDQPNDQVILGGFNLSNFNAEIRVVDVTTGASTILSSYYYNEITAGTIPITIAGTQGLVGYNIYRDGTLVHYVSDPDTLFWYDFTVEPGTHEYGVTAKYDLSEYLTPPPPPLTMFDESMVEGPVEIDIMCGRELPFFEPWDQGSFGFNDWTLSNTTNTNWSVSASTGNTAPSADFSWAPIQYDYSLSLITPVLNGGPFTCATIWCDFDYKLVDRNQTGAEELYVDVFTKGVWKNKAELSNTGSKDWTPMHVDITAAKGKAFKVRFRAEGANSADILHWYVDNVHIYAKCNPPINLDVADINDLAVTLTWSAPECGTEGPEPVWIHWDSGENSDAIGTGAAANFDIAARWDATQIVALDGGAVTKIAFYPASTGSATFSLRVWQGPDAATLLVDQLVPSVTYDEWNIVDVASPVPIDITQELWIGCNVNATSGWPAGCDAGPAIVGYGDMIYFGGVWASMYTAYALDYNWNAQAYVEGLDDHAMKSRFIVPLAQTTQYKSGGTLSASGLPSLNPVKFNPVESPATDARELLGYNIYRGDNAPANYVKLNTNLITDTSYVDNVPARETYYYYVTSVFPTYGSLTCESDSSNVVDVSLVGINNLNGGRIMIYPNPATENVFVRSDFTITNIEVISYIGQTVYSRQNVNDKAVKVNVENLTAGIYFVKVTTTEGIRTVKITVTR